MPVVFDSVNWMNLSSKSKPASDMFAGMIIIIVAAIEFGAVMFDDGNEEASVGANDGISEGKEFSNCSSVDRKMEAADVGSSHPFAIVRMQIKTNRRNIVDCATCQKLAQTRHSCVVLHCDSL